MLQSIVYNFFEEYLESADDKKFRCKSQCSDPDYSQWVNHGVSNPNLSDEDFEGDCITNREALLKRRRDSLEDAYIHISTVWARFSVFVSTLVLISLFRIVAIEKLGSPSFHPFR